MRLGSKSAFSSPSEPGGQAPYPEEAKRSVGGIESPRPPAGTGRHRSPRSWAMVGPETNVTRRTNHSVHLCRIFTRRAPRSSASSLQPGNSMTGAALGARSDCGAQPSAGLIKHSPVSLLSLARVHDICFPIEAISYSPPPTLVGHHSASPGAVYLTGSSRIPRRRRQSRALSAHTSPLQPLR